MSKLPKIDLYSTDKLWMPSGRYAGLHAHVKRAQDRAIILRSSGDNSPVTAHRLVFHYLSHLEQHRSEGLHGCGMTLRDDEISFASKYHVDSEALFSYYGANIVSVLRDKKGSPSPRVRFSLCGFNTKSTRDRLNRYAADLGVKFYCWRHTNSAWAIWVLDGTVLWGPIDTYDSIIATNN